MGHGLSVGASGLSGFNAGNSGRDRRRRARLSPCRGREPAALLQTVDTERFKMDFVTLPKVGRVTPCAPTRLDSQARQTPACRDMRLKNGAHGSDAPYLSEMDFVGNDVRKLILTFVFRFPVSDFLVRASLPQIGD